MDADEGYVLLATGKQAYLEQAYVCAKSIRFFDAKRPIQIITDLDVPHQVGGRKLFDHIDSYKRDDDLPATLGKINIQQYSRFERNLFVDADCIFVQPNIDLHWRRLEDYDFTIPGTKKSTGQWYDTDIADLCRSVGSSYIVAMNSGTIFYKNNALARGVFDAAREAYVSHQDLIKRKHGSGFHGDEPFFGIAMAQGDVHVYPTVAPDRTSLMFSTISGEDFKYDVDGGSFCFSKGGELVTPTICHFVGLRPESVYLDLSEKFSAKYRQALKYDK